MIYRWRSRRTRQAARPRCLDGLRSIVCWYASSAAEHPRTSSFLSGRLSARKISSRLVARVVTFTVNEILLLLLFSSDVTQRV